MTPLSHFFCFCAVTFAAAAAVAGGPPLWLAYLCLAVAFLIEVAARWEGSPPQ
jgi:hypothetical protein